MIRILDEELNLGIDFLQEIGDCPKSPNCLWLRRDNLFMVPNALPKNCPKESCQVVIFRKMLESESPAFYAEALRLSRFHKVIKNIVAVEREGKSTKKTILGRIDCHDYDLHTFGYLVVITIYPLFLEAREIPFFKTAEIENLKNAYQEPETVIQTMRKMHEISPEWLGWIKTVSENLVFDYEYYFPAAIYLAYLFLAGIEKNQLPDLNNMTLREKNKFFSELEKMLFKK